MRNHRMEKSSMAALLGALLLSLTASAASPDAVEYRQNIMKSLGVQAEALVMALEGRVPPEQLLLHVDALARTSEQIPAAFRNAVVGGNAKSELWESWEDFAARAVQLTQGLQHVRDTLNTDDPPTLSLISEGVSTAMNCRGCHDLYRSD